MARLPSLNIQWANNTQPKWWKDAGLRKNVACACFLYLGLFAFGYDTSLVTGMIASPRWNHYFNHPEKTRLGLIVASFYLPAAVCAPLISLSLDGLGRKSSVVLGCFGFILGSLISCFSNSLGMLIAGRAILGTVNFLTIAACTCLVNEILHPRLRGVFGALMMTSLKLGDIVGAWVPFGTLSWESDWSWRLPFLLQALGPFIMVPFMPFCPESPRWLVSKGKEERALEILAKYHANGDRNDDLVKNEMEEITASIRKEQENSQTSWKFLCRTSGNRRRLAVLTLCCTGTVFAGSTVVSSYVAPTLRLIGVTNPAQITGINGGLTIVSALSSTAGALCVDILGRRPIWLGSTSGVLVTFSILTALMSSFIQSPNQSLAVAYIVVLYLYNIAWSFAWLPLTALYAAEILPYSLRAKGISYFVSLQSLLATLALFVNPIGIASLTWRYYIIYIGIIVLHLILVYFLFIETKGRTIEEVALMFDKLVPGEEREGSSDPVRLAEGADSYDEKSAVIPESNSAGV